MRFLLLSILVTCWSAVVMGEDPYIFFTWKVTYGTRSPLGTPEQVILINDEFPGPSINSTTNNNVVVNVFNNLDEPFLITWTGVQQRKNSWQDGVPGTNCPILPGTNWTYHFQVKDQIGSFMYYPSVGMQRASGGFGGLHINSRLLIPVPYADPEDDYTVMINDWYTSSHTDLQKMLDGGRNLGRADGVLINGKNGAKKDDEPLFTMKAGKTYKYRVCNAGLKTSLNFRIQGHTMKVVEMEGSHVVQNVYESLDVHVGGCMAVLVTADQDPKDYYMIASTRFTKSDSLAKGIIRYEGAKPGSASEELPSAPVGWAWSLNQFRSFKWNLTASAARPNPQGSYHYGQINITRTLRLANTVGRVNGKLRYGINGISHVETETPLKLAEYFGVADKVFKYDTMKDDPPASDTVELVMQPNVLNFTFRNFVEIVFENHEKSILSYHLDGYAFFTVGMEPGTWTPDKRKNYNLLDAVSRTSVQVYPKSWSAVLLTFDNAGMWNIRSEVLERKYLGQQFYVSVLSPERSLRDEYSLPEATLLCGIVKDLPKPKPYTLG
ncbi:L-ascorbate oxidase homolog [Linum grandiflorum]